MVHDLVADVALVGLGVLLEGPAVRPEAGMGARFPFWSSQPAVEATLPSPSRR